jgi:predicted MFS family arabinose efflux permease
LGLVIAAPLESFGLVLLGTLLRAVGGGINWVFATQLLLQLVPNRVRGRVFSIEFAFFTLASAVGAAGGGWALDATAIGISGMLWWMAGLTLIPGALWALWMVAGKRSEPLPEDETDVKLPGATAPSVTAAQEATAAPVSSSMAGPDETRR